MQNHYAKLLRATLMASSLTLVAMTETAFAGPTEIFQNVYQNLFGSTQYEKAKAAYDSKDYVTAARLWRSLADQGDASAQYYLGIMYQNGSGVPKNYAEAAKWYQLAAEQDHAPAQANLAQLYDDGFGVPKSKAKAMRLWCRAADGGDPIAQNYLASIPKGWDELCPKF